jgi:hypothetical protein
MPPCTPPATLACSRDRGGQDQPAVTVDAGRQRARGTAVITLFLHDSTSITTMYIAVWAAQRQHNVARGDDTSKTQAANDSPPYVLYNAVQDVRCKL